MADLGSAAYDLSMFDILPIQKPERPAAPQPPRPHVVKARPRSKQQLRREAIAEAIHAVRVFGTATILLILFGAILFSRVNLTMLEREESKYQALISESESEHTRLMMQLNASVSREKVEYYAENVLGMQKLERCQIRYFDNSEKDEVILCNGEKPAQQAAQINP